MEACVLNNSAVQWTKLIMSRDQNKKNDNS